MSKSISYKDAGVDIDAGNEVVSLIKSHVKNTYAPEVLGNLGGFGGMYDLSNIIKYYRHPIMVQSIDGVGTKTIVARMADNFENLGVDLLSACSNDILALGAKTLTMLDYVANDKLDPAIAERFVKGLSKACVENGVSLVGGETAEMPGTYLPGEHDLVGIVTGVVEKNSIIDGGNIIPGDVVLGFASSGLHTNGFSLARKLLFDVAGFGIHQHIDELQASVADVLLAPHINYSKPIHALLDANCHIHGISHITGGGLLENIPRILPSNTAVIINKNSYVIPTLFELLRDLGNLAINECYRVFNMGIGLVIIVPSSQQEIIEQKLKDFPNYDCFMIGEVIEGNKEVILQ